MHGSGEFLAVHEEVAVTGNADNLALWMKPLHRHRCGHAITHRSGRRCDLLGEAPETEEAMNPRRIIAGAVAQVRIAREVLAKPNHYCAEIHRTGLFGRLVGPGAIVGIGGLRLARRSAGKLQCFERRGESRRCRIDRKMRAVDTPQLLGARMHMHERLLRARNVEQRVMLRWQLAQAPADHDDEIG